MMRAGELLGLTWNNVDFDHGVIHIVEQLTQSRGEGHPFVFGTFKTERLAVSIRLLLCWKL